MNSYNCQMKNHALQYLRGGGGSNKWDIAHRMLEQRIKDLGWKAFWRMWSTLIAYGSCRNPLPVKGRSDFWDFDKNVKIKFVKLITSWLEWNTVSFGKEPTEKKENNYECLEIYHLLLPETFKDTTLN